MSAWGCRPTASLIKNTAIADNYPMPNYRRYYLSGLPIFVTVVTVDRRPWLADHAHVQLLIDSMHWAKTKYPFRHIAHVILHDHLHWMLLPNPETNFSKVLAATKRDVTWRLKDLGFSPPFWQERFYDHVIRDEDDFKRHLDYIHFNPVKHGYVSRPADYHWSSFSEWVKRGVYDADWGSIEPDSIKQMNLE